MVVVYHLSKEALDEGLGDVPQLSLSLLADGTLLLNGGEQVSLVGLEVSKVVGLPLQNLVDGERVEVTVDTGEDKRNHLVDSHGAVLLLLQELGQL